MNHITFTVPGAPRGKGRPRISTAGGFARAYTPEQTANYENLVKLAYREKYHESFEQSAVGMRISAYYAIATSASKKKRLAMLDGTIFPKGKPDADNVAKIVCDALNGIAYHDDTQVIYLEVSKRYAEIPRVEIEIWEIREVQ